MSTSTIDIKNLSGATILSAITTEDAISHEELMNSDYIQLSWNSNTGDTLPAGAYIMHGTEKYSLLEPYTPTRADEAEYQYTPQFQSRIMGWQKHPVPIYTYADDGITVETREFDWEFTGSPADAMYMVQQAIKNETGETWTVQLSDSLPATISISSPSGSIFSVLNDIANQCETEWWGDKATNTLYLSQCKHGTAIPLSVGGNVKAPSVTASKDGYFTRFYVFGSSRNVTQDTPQGAATNSIINRRLTLDPATYPGGYIDAKPNMQQGEIFTTTLYYDDIYPSSKLSISDVRSRLKYRLDSSGNKIQTGADDEGNPVYEQYAIWYFQIADFSFDPETIIEGMNLSVSFETGQLAGRDFELAYHEKAETENDSTSDVVPFNIKAGDFEIILDESTGTIIPGLAYIIPQEGDQVILYNIEMPAEYTASARQELAETAQKDIAKRMADNNSYEFDSNPVDFYENDTDLTLGQAVTFSNGEISLSTRVLMVEKHLDSPCRQRIRVGNEIIKGNTQQLREEVTQASQNIDILAAFNELSTSLQNTYGKYQREMAAWVARINGMWRFDPNDPTAIYSDYGVYSNSFISAKGKEDESGGTPTGATKLSELIDVSLSSPSDGQALVYDLATQKWVNKAIETGGIDEEELAAYLTENNYAKKSDIPSLDGYATEAWVTGKNYATVSDLDSRIDALVNGAPAAFDTLKEIADVLQDNVDSIGDILTALGNKVDKVAGKGLSSNDFTDALLAKLNGIEEGANKYVLPTATGSVLGGVKVGATLAIASGVLNMKAVGTAGTYTKVTVDAYGRVTGHSSLAATDIPSLDWSKITSGKPTTLAGYGITDGVNDVSVTGSGNVVSAASISGHTLTLTKGITAVSTSRKVAAGNGLTGGGALSANITINIVSANAGITVNADNIQLNTIDALTSTDTVKPLSAAQGKVIWDFITDLFEKVNIGTSSAPVWAIRAKYGLYTESFLSAKGANPDSGGTVVGVTALSELTDVSITPETLSNNDMLRWNGSKWVAVAMADITPDLSGYATQAWVTSQKYLTTVSIATITDLHSSWDALLKAQKPSTLAGYGITDGVNTVSITGSGNVITTASISGHTLTLNKGITALTSVSIATISDLHSSWDSVLKSQKPAWLTTVSLATISDLHASWDALLKAAPSAYVTRWPTAAEVGALTQTSADARYLLKSAYTAADVLAKLKTVDGSGSGLDADTLDGYQSSSYDLVTNLTGIADRSQYVIGLLQITDYTTTGNQARGRLIFTRANGNNEVCTIFYDLSTRYNTTNVRFGYLKLGVNEVGIYPCTFTYNGKKWAGFTSTNSSNYTSGVQVMRVGLRTGEHSTPFLLRYRTSSTGTVDNSEVDNSLVINGSDIIEDGVTTNLFKGNASSATQLQTARTLWGQSFNGTANVSGNMTGVGNIEMSNIITFTSNNLALRDANGYNVVSRDNAAMYVQNNAGKPLYLGYRGTSILYFYAGSTEPYAAGSNVGAWNTTGLGIGTASPSYKLHVVGTSYFSGAVTAASSIKASSYIYTNTGWFQNNQSGCGLYNQPSNARWYANGSGWFSDKKINATAGLAVTGAATFSSTITASGLITANAGVTTSQYIQVGGGRIKWDSTNNALYVEKSDGTAIGFYSKGWVSAKGANDDSGTGGGGSSYSRLDSWDDYDSSKSGWVLSALLGNDLNTRVESLEAGSALSLTTTGSGNVVTAVSKSGTTLTVTKGITAALSTGTNAKGTWPISITGSSVRITSTAYNSGSLASLTTAGRLYHGGGSNTVTDKPNGVDAFGMFVMQTAAGWTGQMLISSNINTGLYWRTANNDFNGGWRKILDSSNYTGTLDSRYVTLSTAQTISGAKTFSANTFHKSSLYFDYNTDTSRVYSIYFRNTSGNAMGSIGYHNTEKNFFVNPIGSTDPWSDAVGKYSLFVGNNKLTYNTYPILHSANYTSYTVTKTGGGASGTWGISITGNAATATNADTLDGRQGTSYGIMWGNMNTDTDPEADDTTSISITDFLTRLNYSGIFGSKFGAMRGSWYYVGNTQYNTGVGTLEMAGTAVLNMSMYANTSADYKTLLFLEGSTGNMYSYVSQQSGTARWSRYAKTTDNVASATKLATARTINGTSFDGSANITTAKWGTARNIYIRDASQAHTGTAVSVDGSANEYLLLPSTITATLSGNASTASKWATARTLTLTGDATGSVSMDGSANVNMSVNVADSDKLDGYHETSFFRSNISTLANETITNIPANRSGSYILTRSGYNGAVHVFYAGSSNSTMAFMIKGGQSANVNLLTTTDSAASKWTDRGVLLTTSNYTSTLDSRYVNVSGDTMTGNLTANRVIASNNMFILGDTSYTNGRLTFENGALWLQSSQNGKIQISGRNGSELTDFNIKVSSHAAATINDSVIWTAGNDGSGSGLDADLLDGYHVGSLVHLGTANSFDNQAGFLIIRVSTSEGTPSTYGSIFQWGSRSDVTPSTSSVDNWHNQLYGSTSNRLYFRTRTNGSSSWTSWNTLAYTTDNVASATKLQTSRTIWGQSFNGTANVSGNMTGVGSITASNSISITSNSYFITKGGWFQNSTSGNGLYNSACDARWYATSSGWFSDKKINANAGLAVTGAATFSSTITASGPISTTEASSTGPYSYGVAYRAYRSSHTSIEICGGDYVMGLGCNSNGSWNWWRGTSGYSSSAGKSYVMTYNGSTWAFTGALTATTTIFATTGIYSNGYVSAKGLNQSSDIRLKEKISDIRISAATIANAPSFLFSWKKNGLRDVGSSAQYWKNVLPDAVKERDGWLEMAYGNIALISAISLAREVETLEQRVDRLEKENGKLKKKIKELERRAA